MFTSTSDDLALVADIRMEKTTSDNSKKSCVGKIISSTVYCTLMAEGSDKTTPSEDGRAEVAGFYD